jgi:two-component system response regulator YesN
MYKIMLADDEGIVIDSLKFIIEKNFSGNYIVEFATTGRSVIELAEQFKPDIAIMDIQMPGINGIEAMKEIRKSNNTVVFIVMTAYDKFHYAKEAINLGVLEYLTKPVNHNVIVEVLQRAMDIIELDKKKRSNDLKIREKLEIVLPILESDFIYSIISGDDFSRSADNFKNLLSIEEEFGMMMVLEFGDSLVEGDLTNPVGISVKAQSFYSVIRESLREELQGVVGPIMVNKIAIFIPSTKSQFEYDDRTNLIEKSRKLIRDLTKRIDVQFKIGIGNVTPLNKLDESYKEALSAARNSSGRVAHVKDLAMGCEYADDYPIQTEKALFDMIEKGSMEGTKAEANLFFDWMIEHYPDCEMDIKLKVLEFILYAEQKAFLSGMTYYFRYRKDYLPTLIDIDNYVQLRTWFLDKVTEACRNIITKKEKQASDVISKAKDFIEENYRKDISLDDVSRTVDISSYYFSKLFKEETGENFIEYLTNIRIENAKKLLQNRDLSIKNICVDTGYGDPNYFSRIFKKLVGVTPTEYRERM